MNRNPKMRKLALTVMFATAALPAMLIAGPVAPVSAQSVTRPNSELVLSIGRGQLVNMPQNVADIFLANESIADVQVKSPRQVYVFGKAGGETTLYASNAAGDIVYSATIRVGSNIDSVDQMLALAMPDAKVTVSTMNGVVLLTGTVASPDDVSEAQRLVTAFVGDKTQVISRLRTATPLQVNLQVRFAEVSRSLVREIGTNLLTRDNTGGFTFGVSRGRSFGTIGDSINTSSFPKIDASTAFGLPAGTISLPFNPATGQFVVGGTSYTTVGNTNGNTAINLAGKLFGMDVASAFDLAERVGLVTTLSQPNLTALSGETAEFLAGGEFPIPVSQGQGQTSIEYKNYGVSLAYTPIVLANGRISLRVRPEVSELSTQGAVTLNGFQVPALTVRRAETTVELGSGQSFMIAGLLSNNSQNLIDKAPGVGDLPVLGNLFRSTNFRRGETELVIVVTPYLVKPVDANDIVLPTDGYEAPNQAEQLLLNRESSGKTGGDRPKPQTVEGAPVTDPNFGALEGGVIAPPAPPRPERGRKSAQQSATPGFSFE